MACEGGNWFSADCVPEFCCFVEGASGYFGAKGDVEGHAVDCVFVSFEGVDEVTSAGVPDLASAVVAASDEFVAVLVEAAVSEGQDVALQLLDQHELLFPLLLDLLDQF